MRYGKEIKQKAINLYQKGLTATNVGKELGIPTQTIVTWTQKANINRGHNKYSKETKQKALSLYKSGKTIDQVAEELGIEPSKANIIWVWLKKKGVSRGHKKYSLETKQKALKLYKAGVGTQTIAEKLSVNSPMTVWYWLKEEGISRNVQESAHYKEKKISPSKITDANLLWYMGFLFGDGHLEKRNYRICIELNKKDLDILEKFQKLYHKLNLDGAFYTRKNNIALTVYSKKFAEYLQERQFPEGNRIGKMVLPEWIKNHPKVNHFIRGFWEADGGIDINSNRAAFYSTSKQFLESIKDILEENNIKCYLNTRKQRNINWKPSNNLRVSKKDTEKFVKYIYNGSRENTRMNRKYIAAKAMLV